MTVATGVGLAVGVGVGAGVRGAEVGVVEAVGSGVEAVAVAVVVAVAGTTLGTGGDAGSMTVDGDTGVVAQPATSTDDATSAPSARRRSIDVDATAVATRSRGGASPGHGARDGHLGGAVHLRPRRPDARRPPALELTPPLFALAPRPGAMQFLHVVTGGDTHRVVSMHLVNVRGASMQQLNDRDACGAPEGHSMQFLIPPRETGRTRARRRRPAANARRCSPGVHFRAWRAQGSASTTNAPPSTGAAHHGIIRRRKARSTAREARLGDRPPTLAPLKAARCTSGDHARAEAGCRAQAPLRSPDEPRRGARRRRAGPPGSIGW